VTFNTKHVSTAEVIASDGLWDTLENMHVAHLMVRRVAGWAGVDCAERSPSPHNAEVNMEILKQKPKINRSEVWG